MRILVDANILVRFASPGDPNRDIAVDAMQLVAQRGHAPCVVPQVLYEYWVVATRPKENNGLGLTVDLASSDVRRILHEFELMPDDATLFANWFSLVEQKQIKGKLAHDARLVAAMMHHNVTHLLTFNAQDFSRFSEITVIAPSSAASLPAAS